MVQCAWARTLVGGDKPADMRRAGQCRAWNLVSVGYVGHGPGDLLDDIFPDDLDITWPTWYLGWITQNRQVIDKSIHPHIYRLLGVVGHRYTPRYPTPWSGNGKVLKGVEGSK
jgi:hypothetical protein